jgi:anti-sigma-K factor RskA
MTHEELRELAGSYALDAVSEGERRLIETHLDVCPECTGDVAALRATATELAYSAPLRRAPASLRAKVLARAVEPAAAVPFAREATPQASVPVPVPAPAGTSAWWYTAAAILAAVLVGGYALTLRAHIGFLDQALRESRAQTAAAERQLSDAQAQLARAQTEMRRVNLTTGILASADVVKVDLKGEAPAAQALGRAFYSPSRGVLFTANGLPALPASQVYQLWVVTKAGQPVSAGLLAPDAEGRALVLAEPTAESPAAFAVTVEPAGGVPAPTGARVLLGTL